jgi:hypothetical protein
MSESESTAFKDDLLLLQPFSQKLEKYLTIDHDFVSGSLVASLNAPFGAGKTTFLSMWAEDMRLRRASNTSVPLVLMLNAWESDFCGDPLLAITSGLIQELERCSLSERPEAQDDLREAVKDVAWFTVGLANNLASKWTGIDPVGAGNLAAEKKKARGRVSSDILKTYENRNCALQKLKEQLRLIFGSEKPKALVIVDELDRCRPDYAINYLETIKHVFDIHGIVFVLGIDRGHLASSARVLYGNQLNADEYFRKFFQRSFSLPSLSEAGIQKLVASYSAKFLSSEGKRTSQLNLRVAHQIMADFAMRLTMTARQIQELFRLMGHVTGNHTEEVMRIPWGASAMTVMLISLKVARSEMYDQLGTGRLSLEDVGRFIKDLKLQRPLWWLMAYALGVYDGNDREFSEIETVLNKLELRQFVDSPTIIAFIRKHNDAWETFDGENIQRIYRMIESAASFGDR